MRQSISTLVLLFLIAAVSFAGGEWYKSYEDGLKAMERQDWNAAAQFFREAIKGNPIDKSNTRTYGMHFIDYFPHRELGISLYNLGDVQGAQRELKQSMEQEKSSRGDEYLRQIAGNVPPAVVPPVSVGQPRLDAEPEQSPKEADMIVGKQTIKLVGERMGVAVLPFENKGASRDLGEIILDKMITVLVNQQRFKVLERAQIDKILQEQSFGASGIVDAATAAQIGRGIGVDGIIIGSVAAAPSGAISVDARVIDTESAAIIVAQDVFSGSSDAQSVKNAVENLARKITENLPLVEGYIIRIDPNGLILDVGRTGGLRKGMKCVVYKEGAAITHPITGEVLGKETQVIGEILVTESFDKYCVARTLSPNAAMLSIGDKFLTK